MQTPACVSCICEGHTHERMGPVCGHMSNRHCLDLKPLDKAWRYLSLHPLACVHAELWAQGDQEQQLGVPYSLLCDRSTTNIPSSQLGFLSGIVLPSWQLLGQLDPGVSAIALKHVDANKAYHEGLLAEGKNAFR